ncbi:uncharacterized protein LOC132195809 [Neocloeon triangulifer]|uniref:uncharacterized protein LOC132195809 n=1 Tax=Neocloeon triangulifer TaxID=2078957 RepID=UPI00286EDC24|nr:uncharacterized protein LOC132195809 [Neocloeon triangulifer]
MPEYAVGEKDMASNILTQLKSIVFWFKVAELVLNIIIIALVTEGGYIAGTSRAFVALGTPYAFIIISSLMIAGLLLDEALSKRITMVLSAIGGLLFVTAGALMIDYWVNWPHLNDLTIGGGILSILLGLLFFGDAAFTHFKA